MENKLGSVGVRKGAWTKEEDILLRDCIHKFGEGKWHLVPLRTGLNRCRKSCRMRWLNYLKPDLKRGCFAEDEVDLILRMHKLLGNRWSLIAGRLPGRTANDVKNFWNSHICKKPPSNCLARENSTIIVKPRPRTLTMSKHDENVKNKIASSSSSASLFDQEANDDDGGNLRLNHKETSSSPSPPLMLQEDKDECIRWWRDMLEMSENGEGASFSILDEDHASTSCATHDILS